MSVKPFLSFHLSGGFFSTPQVNIANFAFFQRFRAGLLLIIALLYATTLTAYSQEQAPEIYISTGHTGSVQSVVFSPDGETLASAETLGGGVKLWDIASGQELMTLTGSSRASVVFSPDGKTLASGSMNSTVDLWDVASGRKLRSFGPGFFSDPEFPVSIAFSSDGTRLVSGSIHLESTLKYKSTIQLWDVLTGRELKSFDIPGGDEIQAPLVTFTSDGRVLSASFGISDHQHQVAFHDMISGSEWTKAIPVESEFYSAAFSPDGKTLVIGYPDPVAKKNSDSNNLYKGPGIVEVLDTRSGKELRSLSLAKWLGLTFSPDGKILVGQSHYGGIALWDVDSGIELRALEQEPDRLFDINGDKSVAFSSNGRTMASSHGRVIQLWNVASGTKLKTLAGHTGNVTSIAFSPDGRTLAEAIEGDYIRLWGLGSEQLSKPLRGHSGPVKSIDFSPDGKILARGSLDYTPLKLWDTMSGQELNSLTGHTAASNGSVGVDSVAFSPDGKTVASLGVDGTIRLWTVTTGILLRTFQGPGPGHGLGGSIIFSPDGKIIASARDEIKLWDISTGQLLRTLKDSEKFYAYIDSIVVIYPDSSLVFSPDSKSLASTTYNSTSKLLTLKRWDVVTGNEISTFKVNSGLVFSVAFSRDGATMAIRTAGREIKLWDVPSGRELKPIKDVTPGNAFIKFSPDGKTLATVGGQGRVNLWSISDGVQLASLIALDESDWVVVTPGGLFDASPDGRKLIRYKIGQEVVSLDQMKDVYYVPGLLKKVMNGEPLPKVELFSTNHLFPSVVISQPKEGGRDLTVKLTNRGGGFGQLQILVNGKEFVKDARPRKFDANAKEANLKINLKGAPLIEGGENKIEVIARNAAGSLTNRGTRGSEMIYVSTSKKSVETPNIYAIVAGISEYTGDNLKLGFAANDAEAFAKTLEIGAVKLLGDASNVHVRLLTSDRNRSDVKFKSSDAKTTSATKADFQKAFDDFKGATPNDVFIVYLAGHGVSLNLNQNPNQAGGDTYLYLTQEATTTDRSILAVENSRNAMAISSDELKDLMKQNKSLKQVLILDTCAAGALSNTLVGKRDLPSDQVRAIERLKDNTGFFVLMGSAADSVSYEASQYGQGLLTYALFQGMKGAKLRENQFADVSQLFNYVQETVPTLAKNVGGIQRPLIIMPETSASFDIGRFTVDEQKQIVLSNPKPIILRPNLRNSALRFDNLRLTQMMAAQLREARHLQASGEPAKIVFVEADEMTDAILPTGDYTINGDTLKISVILIKNNTPIGREITVTGNKSESEKVVKRLIESLINLLQHIENKT